MQQRQQRQKEMGSKTDKSGAAVILAVVFSLAGCDLNDQNRIDAEDGNSDAQIDAAYQDGYEAGYAECVLKEFPIPEVQTALWYAEVRGRIDGLHACREERQKSRESK